MLGGSNAVEKQSLVLQCPSPGRHVVVSRVELRFLVISAFDSSKSKVALLRFAPESGCWATSADIAEASIAQV